MTALHDLPGTRLLALFARRELSPSEYYEHLPLRQWNRTTFRRLKRFLLHHES
ncbi:hypothetical protein ACXKGW_29595 [Klebsiella pneumoniae subsp. pneumoniae]